MIAVSAKGAQTNIADGDEESVVSARRSYGHGRDIFRKHYPDDKVEEVEEEEDETKEMDEDDNKEVEEGEKDNDETDDYDDEEKERFDDDCDMDDQ